MGTEDEFVIERSCDLCKRPEPLPHGLGRVYSFYSVLCKCFSYFLEDIVMNIRRGTRLLCEYCNSLVWIAACDIGIGDELREAYFHPGPHQDMSYGSITACHCGHPWLRGGLILGKIVPPFNESIKYD